MLSVTSPDGGTTDYLYNEFGWLEEEQNELGESIGYAYDRLGRITQKSRGGSVEEYYCYDGYDNACGGTDSARDEGRLTMVSDNAGTVKYEYDDRGRLFRETRSIGQSSFMTTYSYDVNGYARSSPLGAIDPAGLYTLHGECKNWSAAVNIARRVLGPADPTDRNSGDTCNTCRGNFADCAIDTWLTEGSGPAVYFTSTITVKGSKRKGRAGTNCASWGNNIEELEDNDGLGFRQAFCANDKTPTMAMLIIHEACECEKGLDGPQPSTRLESPYHKADDVEFDCFGRSDPNWDF